MFKPIFLCSSLTFLLIHLSAVSKANGACGPMEKLQTDIEASHLEGNIPPENKFQKFLERDLKTYFLKNKLLKKVAAVEAKLLRDGPTQSGMGFPHYYAWTSAYDQAGTLLTTGAVRLDAIARKSFGVTDFVSSEDILKSRESIEYTFPTALHEIIILKAHGSARRKLGI
jgi:hypothetical protein